MNVVLVHPGGERLSRSLVRVGKRKLHVRMAIGEEAKFWISDGTCGDSRYRHLRVSPASLEAARHWGPGGVGAR